MPMPAKEEFRYLTASRDERRWGLFVPGIGYAIDQRQGLVDPSHPRPYFHTKPEGRILPEYQLIYVTRGEGYFRSETTAPLPLAAGNLFVLFPGVWHCFDCRPGTAWDLRWIGVHGEQFDCLRCRRVISADRPLLQIGSDEAVLAAFRRAWDHVLQNPPGLQPLLAAAAMEVLAAALSAAAAAKRPSGPGPIVHQAMLMLQNRCQDEVDMPSLAEELHISYSRFRHMFRTEAGCSPYQYHLRLRIRRAQELLRTSAMTVRQVAASLAFDDPYHFSKIFKEKTGYSPAQWRGGQRAAHHTT